MSIREIAREAGTSISTVSRVLNDPGYKCRSEELRDRIREVAMEHNYTPNPAARFLKAKTPEKLYYINVLMARTDQTQTDPFFSELLRVIETQIRKNTCILSHVWYMPICSNENKCARLDMDREIDAATGLNINSPDEEFDGLVIVGKCCDKALNAWKKRCKHIVSINRNSTTKLVDEVTCDGMKIAMTAVEHLASLGHTQIGYIGSCHHEARYRGFQAALHQAGLELIPDYIVETDQTERMGYEAMEELTLSDDRPTGIYCANDITAIGALKYIQKNSRKHYHPSIISADDIDDAGYTKPMLTTVRLPRDEMAYFAIMILMDRLNKNHTSICRMEFEGTLMVRESCRPPGDDDWSGYSG
ncbi:MAG: LacI family DNA-binding transcriptional regulator [Eubacterium sp.]|nr:LacI family DNA-binding transcriptional regulator [Eubacterium sp.]